MRLLCVVLLALSPACSTYGATYRELEITGHSSGDIWREITNFARSRGFSPDSAATDVGLKTFTTRWQGRASAFRRGSRRRFHALIEATENGLGWRVRYHVEVQQVSDLTKNMRPEEDDWEFAGQDRTKEQEFFRVMSIAFRPERPAKAETPAAKRAADQAATGR